MPPRPTSLQFRVGSANAPDSPFGRDELDISADGRVAYRNLFRTTTRSATAQLAPAALDKVLSLFAASPFPASPSAQIPPGSSLCELAAGDATMQFDYHTGRKAPGYAELVRLLDGWVTLLRGPADKRRASDELVDIVDA